jgi:hypothetical protein
MLASFLEKVVSVGAGGDGGARGRLRAPFEQQQRSVMAAAVAGAAAAAAAAAAAQSVFLSPPCCGNAASGVIHGKSTRVKRLTAPPTVGCDAGTTAAAWAAAWERRERKRQG